MKNDSDKTGENNPESIKTNYTLGEMIQLAGHKPDYLLAPILPRIGTVILAAKPDVGKSQFARQLALAIISGLLEFLGLMLNAIHRRAIFVATEDHAEAISFLVKKQLEKFKDYAEDNLVFICADTMTPEEIYAKLSAELKKAPTDLVVVDSFGDIFPGQDLNNNAMVRRVARFFDKLSKRHKCALLFIHHINKAAYGKSPGQQYIQGGSGLVQRVRAALFLSEGKGSKRYLSIVKGNYVSKQVKSQAIELEFCEETFTFTATGNKIPVEEVAQYSHQGRELNPENLRVLAEKIFEGKTLRHTEIIDKYMEESGESESTAKRFLKKLMHLNIVVKSESGYYLHQSDSLSQGSTYPIDFDTLNTQQS